MSSEPYEKTSLWLAAFDRRSDGLDVQREKLANAYFEFRERVALMLSKIQGELPTLTVHDITHVDALWRVASQIAGSDFQLNPAEAFVLGGAFLLHDAAHCRAAFPGGVAEIRSTTEWSDVAAQGSFSDDLLTEGSPAFQSVLFDTLRVLHPKRARKLAFAKWSDSSGGARYLLPNDDLRDAYGDIIGRIAESHWFNPHELEVFAATTITAPACLVPGTWTVNPLKVAVLLRVSDAAHIDAKRAPRILLAMNHLGGVSKDHWLFQARLHQPTGDACRGELMFSGSPFPASEQAAWWLAYEAACLADKELTAANHILRDHSLQPFAIKEVAGIRSPEAFARSVPTEGWFPIDACLRIGNVPSIVEKFGGVKLYGDEPQLALRELLQNARDAVMASRALKALEEHEGSITVHLEEQDGKDWLHVTDTGIGMSRYVLTQVLLDFGRSLWRDAALRREWPGLATTEFDAVGRFGIGFFSVFMLGIHIKVTTYRQTGCGNNEEKQWVLEFDQGFQSRPCLRQPTPHETLARHGTRVSVQIQDKSKLLRVRNRIVKFFRNSKQDEEVMLTLSQVVGALAPALDIDLYTREFGEAKNVKVLTACDWRYIDPMILLERINPGRQSECNRLFFRELESAAKRLSNLSAGDGKLQGRCAIMERSSKMLFSMQFGVVTVGGLYGGPVYGIAGVMVGKQADLLNRSTAIPLVDSSVLSNWAENQARLLLESDQMTWGKSSLVMALGASTRDLFVIGRDDGDWTANQVYSELNSFEEIWIIDDRDCEYDADSDEVRKSDFQMNISFDNRLFRVKDGVSSNEFLSQSSWPEMLFPRLSRQPVEVFVSIVNEIWPDSRSVEMKEMEIGDVSGTPIFRDVKVVFKVS